MINQSISIVRVLLKCVGRGKMEPSESKSFGSSSNDPQFGSQSEPSSPVPQASDSDLNHVVDADAPGGELQSKLELKGGDESGNKDSNFEAEGGGVGTLCDETGKRDSNFEAGGGELSVEGGAPESVEGHECDGDHHDDGVAGGDWNDDDNGCNRNENVKENENDKAVGDVDGVEGDGEEEKKEDRSNGDRAQHYPLRPQADDCAFYLKTGTCKFGLNCKFNHPVRRKNQAVKEKVGEREEQAEKSGQTECKYYLTSGGCKFGKACKFNHTRGKSSAAPILELNFLGLPIRLGERECPYYMRTGCCKFGANCKFNHPDPTVGRSDPPSGYSNGNSVSLQVVSQPSVRSWSSPRTLSETVPLVPVMLSPAPAVAPQSSEWNGYQAPVYLERSMHPPSTYVMNNPAVETNVYMHQQKLMVVEEFPERPGEPECSFFLKTGDCKFKANCKFHHPKNRIAKSPPCSLSDKGLPLRPDQNVCTHYSRYGICKFGPACKYDHPVNPPPSTGLEQQSSYTNAGTVAVAGMGGSEGASDVTIQQPV